MSLSARRRRPRLCVSAAEHLENEPFSLFLPSPLTPPSAFWTQQFLILALRMEVHLSPSTRFGSPTFLFSGSPFDPSFASQKPRDDFMELAFHVSDLLVSLPDLLGYRNTRETDASRLHPSLFDSSVSARRHCLPHFLLLLHEFHPHR